jgi:hypothetical protein
MSETFTELCQRYLDALDADVDQQRIEELDEEIADLQDERSGYIEDYGEDDVLVQRVDEELDDLQAEKTELEGAVDQVAELQESVLERIASEFIADEEFLTEPSLEALNHIFTDSPEPKLLIEDWEVHTDADLEEHIRPITDYIRKLAMGMLGTNDAMKELWENIEGTKKYEPFIIVAQADEPLSPSQVADRMDEDIESDTVGTRFRNAIHQFEYHPYHRVEGDYTLSTVGKFIFHEYCQVEKEEEGEEQSDSESDEQVTLDAAGDANE